MSGSLQNRKNRTRLACQPLGSEGAGPEPRITHGIRKDAAAELAPEGVSWAAQVVLSFGDGVTWEGDTGGRLVNEPPRRKT